MWPKVTTNLQNMQNYKHGDVQKNHPPRFFLQSHFKQDDQSWWFLLKDNNKKVLCKKISTSSDAGSRLKVIKKITTWKLINTDWLVAACKRACELHTQPSAWSIQSVTHMIGGIFNYHHIISLSKGHEIYHLHSVHNWSCNHVF